MRCFIWKHFHLDVYPFMNSSSCLYHTNIFTSNLCLNFAFFFISCGVCLHKLCLGIYRNNLDLVSICLFVHPSVSVCNLVWLVIIFLIEKHCKFLLDTKIPLDLMVYHDHDLKSFWQVKIHWKENCIIFVQSIHFL